MAEHAKTPKIAFVHPGQRVHGKLLSNENQGYDKHFKNSESFLLSDNQSAIALNQEEDGPQLNISSAVQQTGYKWQMTDAKQVNWSNHFVNKLHEDNNIFNAIEPFPIQFKEIKDGGVSFSQK